MKIIVCILFFVMSTLIAPHTASAADLHLDINISRTNDGATCGEIWLNDHILWRLELIGGDSAKPVGAFNETKTTLLTADIENGLLLLKVNN